MKFKQSMKRAICVFLTLVLTSVCLSPPKVSGADCSDPAFVAKSFSSTQDITFSIDDKGTASVIQKVNLKNLAGGCRVPEYILRFNTQKIKNVFGKDSLGELIINVGEDKSITTISARLNDEVEKKDKSVDFELHYTIEELAAKEGLIWSLVAPKITTGEKITAYSLKILVPVSFGKVFSIFPAPANITYSSNQTILDFGKDQSPQQYIFANFGNWQEIPFRFKVPIKKWGLFGQRVSVSLPPDTERQQLLIKNIKPAPEKTILDKNGNYLADYKATGKGFSQVEVEGKVRVVGEGKKFLPPLVFSKSDLDSFKGSSRYIQSQDRLIQEKAKELKTAESIYNFVVGYLHYDAVAFSAGKADRKGAAELLRKQKPATNLDFVDLFVALARAAGIPAREVFGFVISGSPVSQPVFVGSPLNTKKMHVWAQIYDYQKGFWFDVDPTWANTTGVDYYKESFPDRFAVWFSTTGEDLDLLKNLVSSGDISIPKEVLAADFSPKVNLEVKSDQVFAGFPSEITVNLENKSGVSLTGVKVKLTAEGVNLAGADTAVLPVLFPFEKKTFKFRLSTGNLVGDVKGVVRASLEAKSGDTNLSLSKQEKVLIKPFFSLGIQQILLLALVLLIVVGVVVPKLKRR